jgi:hypothetical protein
MKNATNSCSFVAVTGDEFKFKSKSKSLLAWEQCSIIHLQGRKARQSIKQRSYTDIICLMPQAEEDESARKSKRYCIGIAKYLIIIINLK